MISWTHLSSRTVSDDPTVAKAVVETPLELADDVISTVAPLHYEPTIDVAIGKLPNGERRYVSLPFWNAMALEGYKLHVNAKVSPKKTDGMSADERASIIATMADGAGKVKYETMHSMFDVLNAKAKKAFVESLKELRDSM